MGRHRDMYIHAVRTFLLAGVLLAVFTASSFAAARCPPVEDAAPGRYRGVPVYGYEVINVYPHDRDAFTQGLLWADGGLYESTGGFGTSTLRRTRLEDGRVLQKVSLARRYFAEGIVLDGERILQLTWRSRTGFVYDRTSLRRTGSFRYDTEGWGLARVEDTLVLSDGSAILRFLDPFSYRERRRVTVHDGCGPVLRLNELEYVQGRLYANVWHSDRIAIIDPGNGQVQAWVDLAGLLPAVWRRSSESVLNGIAYDPQGGRLFVTGKNWPRLFEIRVLDGRPPHSGL